MIDAVEELLPELQRKQRTPNAIEISYWITLYVSLPTSKVKILKERHISDVILHKTPDDIVDFESLVFFVLSQRIRMHH